MDNLVNYMKYIPSHGQSCKVYEIYTLTGTFEHPKNRRLRSTHTVSQLSSLPVEEEGAMNPVLRDSFSIMEVLNTVII